MPRLNCWKSFLVGCWKPSRRQYEQMRREEEGSVAGEDDALIWCRELEKHYYGEFSFAIVQANQVLEDYSQVDTGKEVTFAGVYDGHGGPDAAHYISNHLFKHLVRFTREHGKLSDEVLANAFSETENGFLTLVGRGFEIQPLLAANGSCCLVGVIWKGTLYIANLGDSRAVLGVLSSSGRISADQLTREHNAAFADVREELRSLHPDDSNIVCMRNGAWRIKGIIQVSRSIGDAYMKRPEFALGPSFPRFHLPEAITRPVLRSDPSVCSKHLTPNDKFLIIASDGLWEHLSNQKAVEIVHSNPRPGIARRLIKLALMEAARKANVSYDVIKQTRRGARRTFHDDITVIVIFIDHQLLEEGVPYPVLSVKGFRKNNEPSDVNIEQGLEVNPSSFGQSSEAGPSQSSKARLSQSSEAGPSQSSKARLSQSSEARPSQSSEAGPSQSSKARLSQSSEAGPSQSSEAGPSQSSEAGPSQSSKARLSQSSEARQSQSSEGGLPAE